MSAESAPTRNGLPSAAAHWIVRSARSPGLSRPKSIACGVDWTPTHDSANSVNSTSGAVGSLVGTRTEWATGPAWAGTSKRTRSASRAPPASISAGSVGLVQPQVAVGTPNSSG